MVSFITASQNLFNSHHFFTHLNFPLNSSQFLDINPERTRKHRRQVAFFHVFGFAELRRRSGFCSWSCWCKRWESDGDLAVEAEILEFMKKSDKPEAFPTKEELLDAGRLDLVDAILRIGGWLSLGWGLDDENEEDVTVNSDSGVGNIGEFKRRVESIQESNSFEEAEVGCSGEPSVSMRSSPSASPSGISLGLTTAEEDAGIKGILSRLEKQRNLSFGIKLGKNGCATHASSKDDGDHMHFGTSTDRADLEKNIRLTSGSPSQSISNNSGSKPSHNVSLHDPVGLRNKVQPELWRTWSLQRAGSSNTEFEAAEISFNENQMERRKEDSKDETLGITEVTTEALDRQTGINHNQIRTHLQHLEHELSSALLLLRSKSEEFMLKGNESTSSDLQLLSDAWEFQENEFMNAQNKLRSIRAKLAVLEGKMALAIIDAQKIAEEKQKRIDGARTAFQLLRTTRVIWPNSASEVLLAGSFDGWTTQRKMEKSSTGIFSVRLKLYPGRYEIKFIVDGMWRIDPLRPIVHNNRYENNLLIIT